MTRPSADSPSSTIGRIKRLIAVKNFLDDGKTTKEIAVILDTREEAISQDRRYLRELLELGLTPDAINEKRGELYLEYCDATDEAKKLFEQYRDDTLAKSTDKKRFFMAWIDTIDRKAKLWGFDNVKIDIGAINTQINQGVEYAEKLDYDTKQKIATAIKDDYEKRQQEKYEADSRIGAPILDVE